MDTPRFVTGIIFLVGSIILLAVSIFSWVFLIYAIPLLIIGILLLIDIGKEDQIEKVRKFK